MSVLLGISEARKKLNTLDRDLERDVVIYVTRSGKRVFVVVNAEYIWTVIEMMEFLSDPKKLEKLKSALDN